MDPAPTLDKDIKAGDFDPDLLDRMIGAKGDAASVAAKSHALQMALAPLLQSAFEKATGVLIEARAGDVRPGLRRELLAELGRGTVYCTASIAGWSRDISYLCESELIIGLVECLLGGADPDQLDIVGRPLSGIELDMSLVVFEQLNDCLRNVVSSDPKARASVAKPQSDVPDHDDTMPDVHAAALSLELEFGAISTRLTLIIPQSILLKTKLNTIHASDKAQAEAGDWTERLSQRVVRSEVDLQAVVALQPLRLSEISRLQPGDLIAFADTGDINVMLSANGTQLYSCALGRSGTRYKVKIERQAGTDDEWKAALT